MEIWTPGTVYRHFQSGDSLPIDYEQAYRYMGYPRNASPEGELLTYIPQAALDQQKALKPQAVYAYYPCHVLDHETVDIDFVTIHSKHLSKHLQDCDHVIIFAATIGASIDRLIMRASAENPAYATVMHALGAMFVEVYCDAFENEIKQKVYDNGGSTRYRFSPGYFDLTLELQKDLFRVLAPQINSIGLTLTDTLLMRPSKSVTAIIGISLGNEVIL